MILFKMCIGRDDTAVDFSIDNHFCIYGTCKYCFDRQHRYGKRYITTSVKAGPLLLTFMVPHTFDDFMQIGVLLCFRHMATYAATYVAMCLKHRRTPAYIKWSKVFGTVKKAKRSFHIGVKCYYKQYFTRMWKERHALFNMSNTKRRW